MSGSGSTLRVLVVDGHAGIGGAARWLLDVLAAASGITVAAVLLDAGPLEDELRALGIEVSVTITTSRLFDVARASIYVRRRMRSFDVVVANGVKAATIAVLARPLTRIRIVWVKHDFSRDRRLGRWLAGRVDLLIGTSAELVAAVGRPGSPVLVPPRDTVVPASRQAAIAHWRDAGFEFGDVRVAAVVGRLIPYKRVDDAIRALALPAAAGWRLVVVGPVDRATPREWERLAGVAAVCGVASRVIWVGEHADVRSWLAAFSVVIVPTGVDAAGFGGEGFGMVVLESLLAGVPVIATEGIPASALGDGAVVVVSRERPDEIAAALPIAAARTALARIVAGRLRASYPDASEVAAAFITELRSVASAT